MVARHPDAVETATQRTLDLASKFMSSAGNHRAVSEVLRAMEVTIDKGNDAETPFDWYSAIRNHSHLEDLDSDGRNVSVALLVELVAHIVQTFPKGCRRPAIGVAMKQIDHDLKHPV